MLLSLMFRFSAPQWDGDSFSDSVTVTRIWKVEVVASTAFSVEFALRRGGNCLHRTGFRVMFFVSHIFSDVFVLV